MESTKFKERCVCISMCACVYVYIYTVFSSFKIFPKFYFLMPSEEPLKIKHLRDEKINNINISIIHIGTEGSSFCGIINML